MARGRKQDATRGITPGADQGRQAGVTIETVVGADRRRPRRTVGTRQLDDFLLGDAADGSDPRRWVIAYAFGQRIVAERVSGNVIGIDQVLGHQHMHQPQGQGGVGTRQRRNMHMALLGGRRAEGVDRHQAGAAPLCFLDARP